MPESIESVTTVEQRSGHLEVIRETAAKLLLFQQGWNPYSRFLDQDKVDLILRRKRGDDIDYREIQVKYRRLYHFSRTRWAGKLFSLGAWYAPDPDEFVAHRHGLFVMFIFGHPDRSLDKDVLIFPSCDLHRIIQQAPLHKKGGAQKSVYLWRSSEGRWYVLLTRKKFLQIDANTCVDVTKYRNNFAVLD